MGGAQVTDFNPGVQPNGLFWTMMLDEGAVDVNLAAGTATMHAEDVHVMDYHDLENALLGNGAAPVGARVSFTVKWAAMGDSTQFDNPAQKYRGTMRTAAAQMDWTARSGIYEYTSAPLETSTTDAAQIGTESNGSFF